MNVDTFDGAKPRFLNRGEKRRSVLTLRIPRASARGVEWVDSRRIKVYYSSVLLEGTDELPYSGEIGIGPYRVVISSQDE